MIVPLTSFDALGYVPDANVLQVCRDLLAGYRGDYYMFACGGRSVILLTDFENAAFSGGTFTAGSCTVHEVAVSVGSGDAVQAIRLYDNPPSAADAVIVFRGSIVNNDVYHLSTYTTSDVHITNSHGYLVYGSFDDLPHLQSGGDHYAYAGLFLACTCCIFVLLDKIFSRLYSRS